MTAPKRSRGRAVKDPHLVNMHEMTRWAKTRRVPSPRYSIARAECGGYVVLDGDVPLEPIHPTEPAAERELRRLLGEAGADGPTRQEGPE
jgi:hypothetical protein